MWSHRPRLLPLLLGCQVVVAGVGGADDAGSAEFFEKKIRPVLVEECFECHSRDTRARGGLVLDDAGSLLDGGERGAAILPGDGEGSLLWQVVAHRHEELEMPRNKPRLPDAVVEDLRRWIEAGAHWPDHPAGAGAGAEEGGTWEAAFERRKDWWSLRPLVEPGGGEGGEGGGHMVDWHIGRALAERGLVAAGRADARSQLRRLSYVVTGLPPTREEQERFLGEEGDGWWDEAIEHYLDQPGFGEAWARHWMDWVRYAESHGSEGDPAIPHAWRYRDYLVRALNEDVPWDRLIEEHVAGDLLPVARRLADGTDDSAPGVAQLRMVQHGFTPTDAHDEFITFVDNQVDVVSKAFLGLTVSCARCHHHKFDAISQEDYYAMFGIFAGARPALVNLAPRDGEAEIEAARRAGDGLRRAVAGIWRDGIDGTLGALGEWRPDDEEARRSVSYHHPLAGWLVAGEGGGAEAAAEWGRLVGEWEVAVAENRAAGEAARFTWQAGDEGFWSVDGPGLAAGGDRSGGILPSSRDGVLVEAVVPPGIVAGSYGDHLRGVAMSREFIAEGGDYHISAMGGGGAKVRYVVWQYPRSGLIYPKLSLEDGRERRQTWDLDYWKGERIYWEIATAADAPVEAGPEGGRSWFVITGVRHGGPRPREEGGPVWGVAGGRLAAGEAVADRERVYRAALEEALVALEAGELGAGQAAFLQELLSRGWLANRVEGEVAEAHRGWREAIARLAAPVRAPGVWETEGADHVLYERGDPRRPQSAVPRRFLSAIDPVACGEGSGRLGLARALVAGSNPVTPRVMVNRVWHHVFGRGLAATPDNLGRLGPEPSHPELLDELAWRFREEHGWSAKSLLRLLLSSETFRRSVVPPAGLRDRDPEGEWLAWYPLRRLPAEAVRDSLLASSGLLDGRTGGLPAARDEPRRSIYLPVVRNSPVPFLAAFDQPAPFAPVGARDATNVPAQALTMMNDPFVERCAERVVEEVVGEVGQAAGAEEIVAALYRRIFGREPDGGEVREAAGWVGLLGEGEPALGERREGLAEELVQVEEGLAAMYRAVLASRGGEEVDVGGGPEADLEWDFGEDEGEVEGRVGVSLMGGAKVEGGALHTGEDAWLETGALPIDLGEKTFEAWVSLTDTRQRGGGLVAVETLSPHAFDALVFGERQAGVWMAGSEFFRRTRDGGGVAEGEQGERMVHMVLVHGGDGSTLLYRNGEPYGEAYRVEGAPVVWKRGEAKLLMGRRHSPPGNQLELGARIHRVRVYARALGAEEIRASLARHPVADVGEGWIQELVEWDRERAEQLVVERGRLLAEIAELGDGWRGLSERQSWVRLAHALYNMKEFLYLP
jgi:hypothetical protein